MSNIEKIYEQHAVKINSNGITGSGCIVQSSVSNYTFIFTAKHCLTESDKIEIENIKITNSNSENSFKIINTFLHNELDVAVIQIEKINGLKATAFSEPSRLVPVFVFGYPNLLKNENQIISCKISFKRDNYSEIEFNQPQTTFEKSTSDTIKGFSGSGIFLETGSDLSIAGILTRLKAPDGAYSIICAYHIKIFDDLIVAKGLPSIFSDNISDIVKDYEIIDKAFSVSYNLSIENYCIERQVDMVFNNYLNNPKNVWISGNPSVGKTFLISRNLRRNHRNFIHIDLTCSALATIDEYFEYINNEIINQKDIQELSSELNIYNSISSNLKNINSQTNRLYIFIDEVPIFDKERFNNFLIGFIKISERFSNMVQEAKQIKWIISTRNNPQDHFNNFENCIINKAKALKNFNFKNLDFWTNDELLKLLELLENVLNFKLSKQTQEKILNISKGTPSILKSVIERIILDNCTIEEAIDIVKSEHL